MEPPVSLRDGGATTNFPTHAHPNPQVSFFRMSSFSEHLLDSKNRAGTVTRTGTIPFKVQGISESP